MFSPKNRCAFGRRLRLCAGTAAIATALSFTQLANAFEVIIPLIDTKVPAIATTVEDAVAGELKIEQHDSSKLVE